MTQSQVAKASSEAMSQAELRHHLGAVLKEARSKAGVSIEAVAHETKISKQFIIYLESGLLENLPGKVFGRGFIKNIARYLRSDSQELLKLYEECWGEGRKAVIAPAVQSVSVEDVSTDDVTGSTPKAVEQHKRVSEIPDIKELPSVKSKSSLKIHVPSWLMRGIMTQNTLLTILASIAAVMVIGVLGRWVVAHWNRAAVTAPVAVVAEHAPPSLGQETANTESNEFSSTAAMTSDSDPMVPANVVEKVIDPSATRVDTNSVQGAKESDAPVNAVPVAATASLPAATDEESPLSVTGTPVAFEQLIELKVNTPVDIKVSLDGKKSERITYAVGVTQLTFRDRVELMIQDASAVEVSFNGKSLGVLGNKGRKRRVFFQAKPSESDFPH